MTSGELGRSAQRFFDEWRIVVRMRRVDTVKTADGGAARLDETARRELFRRLRDVNPAPTTELVLVGGGGRLAKQLTDAVKKSGGTVIDSSPPSRPKDRQAWVAEQAAAAGVRLDPQAVHLRRGLQRIGALPGFFGDRPIVLAVRRGNCHGERSCG